MNGKQIVCLLAAIFAFMVSAASAQYYRDALTGEIRSYEADALRGIERQLEEMNRQALGRDFERAAERAAAREQEYLDTLLGIRRDNTSPYAPAKKWWEFRK